MKSNRVRGLGVILAVALVMPTAAPTAAEPPRILEPRVERHQGPPLWISASAVAHVEKIVDLDLIDDPMLRRSVEKQDRALRVSGSLHGMSRTGEKPAIVDIPLSDCGSMLDVVDHRGGEAPSSSVADLLIHSQGIFRGSIKSIERGFSSGVPASLLEIRIEEVIKGDVPGEQVYLEYLVAHFRIGPYTFCNANRAYEPGLGDQVLLFDYMGPADRDGVLYSPRFEQIFFQTRSGTLVIPPKLKSDGILDSVQSLDEVAAKLRGSRP